MESELSPVPLAGSSILVNLQFQTVPARVASSASCRRTTWSSSVLVRDHRSVSAQHVSVKGAANVNRVRRAPPFPGRDYFVGGVEPARLWGNERPRIQLAGVDLRGADNNQRAPEFSSHKREAERPGASDHRCPDKLPGRGVSCA